MNKADKKEMDAYAQDMQRIKDLEEIEAKEDLRREFAQQNGNDSGYDPYWHLY